jgi:hypothetical protein
MKSCESFAPFLGIEPGGDRGRSHQVAEQHRQMTALPCWPLNRLRLCINRLESVQWRGAPRAKSGLVTTIEGALRAAFSQRRSTLITKPRSRCVVGSAVRAQHRQTLERPRYLLFYSSKSETHHQPLDGVSIWTVREGHPRRPGSAGGRSQDNPAAVGLGTLKRTCES